MPWRNLPGDALWQAYHTLIVNQAPFAIAGDEDYCEAFDAAHEDSTGRLPHERPSAGSAVLTAGSSEDATAPRQSTPTPLKTRWPGRSRKR